jgi:hypothetical protein
VAAALPLETAIAVKNTVALARERWEEVADAAARGVSPRLLWGALAGELVAMIALFASGNVPPALVATLQLFLRF